MPYTRPARIHSAHWAVILTSSFVLSGCGGSSSNDKPAPPVDTTPFTGELRGVLTAPNGTSAIPGATVFIPNDGVSPLAFTASSIHAQGNSGCAEPPVTSLAWGCTDALGRFSFSIDLPAGSTVQLNAVRGAWSMSTQVVLNFASAGVLRFPASPEDGAARIAVVTGAFDNIENVLAKMGLAEWEEWDGELPFPIPLAPQMQALGHGGGTAINFQGYRRLAEPAQVTAGSPNFSSANLPRGSFRPGTETFSIYDGIYGYEDEEGEGDWPEPPDYPSVAELFKAKSGGQPARIFDYDIVYINCGAIEPDDLEDEYGIDDWSDTLRAYVSNGGVLYVTDLSSPYITGAFSHYVNFAGTGSGVDELVGKVEDTDLRNYLRNSQCENGGACASANGDVTLYDFLGGWHLLAPETGMQGQSVQKLVTGDVSGYLYGATGSNLNGLTLAFNHGQGKVIFSSYHVSGGFVTRPFTAQERILERLFWVTTGG